MQFCPHCGTNLTPDKVEERNGFSITPSGEVRYKGQYLNLRRQPGLMLHTLAAAGGNTVSKTTIIGRISETDSVWPEKFVDAIAAKTRKQLRGYGVPVPFETVWGVGLRWSMK
jgi:DNA-binding response OmpR family regulator